MEYLALILVFPIVWPFIAKAIWGARITVPELALNVLGGCVLAAAGYAISVHVQSSDVEIHNGRVVAKEQDSVSCDHSYSCNCTKHGCSTCYEHAQDYNWVLKTQVGDIQIDRLDRQGKAEPPRYSRARIGDAVAIPKTYENLVRAAPDSLFNASSEKLLVAPYAAQLPKYPATVYDYHHVNRIVLHGVALPDAATWNSDLQELLATLGPQKQVNAILVFTREPSPQFAEALRIGWLGGKKNDVIVVLGTPEYPKINWVKIISWTDQELFKVQLRDSLLEQSTVNREAVLDTLSTHIRSSFKRKSMKDFEYLRNEIRPPLWVAVLIVLLSLGGSITLSYYFARN